MKQKSNRDEFGECSSVDIEMSLRMALRSSDDNKYLIANLMISPYSYTNKPPSYDTGRLHVGNKNLENRTEL